MSNIVYVCVLEFCGLRLKVFLYHQSNLEGDRMLKLAKVKAGDLSYLLKSVYERVSVYEELS